MSTSLRALLCMAFVGCTQAPPGPPDACVPSQSAVDAGVATCDAPAVIDPSVPTTHLELVEAAGALVCDWSLRCQNDALFLGVFFCHPEFAALQARRSGVDVLAPVDPAMGRACLDALLGAQSCDAASDAAGFCLSLLITGVPPLHPTSLLGQACPPSCMHGLECVSGVCQRAAPPPRAQEGEACTSIECGPDLTCDAGRCRRLLGDGDECCGDCDVGHCLSDGRCHAVHHLGCACSDDVECPFDVARCVSGTCVARPMFGEACSAQGAPCYGSICDAGTCRLFHDGEEPCGHNLDCDAGLRCHCAPGGFACAGRCGPPSGEHDACASSAECDVGLYCADGATCAPRAALGAPCDPAECVEGATCTGGVCVAG